MNTIKNLMENYVNFLGKFSDPFDVGMSVHIAIFIVNRFILYLLLRGFSKNSKSDGGKSFHEYVGFISFILGYFLTVAFIWIKNN